ncbi:MAG TPA: redox-regulated ATPase YchF [Chloroflexota bacterium]|nr:redox-regulated ATPase YchF [Chloroflexota bacterium]
MQIAIIGLPMSGKTTVFNALTGARAKTGAYAAAADANLAVVQVPDPRLEELAKIFKPKKVIHATVEYVDAGGVVKGSAKVEEGTRTEGMSGRLLNQISKADALLNVVRVFEDESVPHPEGSVDPARDVATMDLELAYSDLAIIERRMERLKESVHKVKPLEREAGEREMELLSRIKADLEREIPIRAQKLTEEESLSIRAFQFLSEKPLLHLLNLGEGQMERAAEIQDEVSRGYDVPQTAFTTLCGQVEAEVAELDPEEKQQFLEAMGVTESGVGRVIAISYQLLDYVSFLTVGPDEVRAWTIRRNTPAQKAAGVIHSDLERGFIRAEVVKYTDLMAAGGSRAEAKKHGTVRLEGKSYPVQDGDIMEVLFNV